MDDIEGILFAHYDGLCVGPSDCPYCDNENLEEVEG